MTNKYHKSGFVESHTISSEVNVKACVSKRIQFKCLFNNLPLYKIKMTGVFCTFMHKDEIYFLKINNCLLYCRSTQCHFTK